MHGRMHWFFHLSISSEATVYLTTVVLTTGAHNPQFHMQSGNVFSLTFVYCCVVVIT